MANESRITEISRSSNAAVKCRVCECTDQIPCFDPETETACYWVEPDLCSSCAEAIAAIGLWSTLQQQGVPGTFDRLLAEVSRLFQNPPAVIQLVSDGEANAFLRSRAAGGAA